ncbi:MAG: glycosyltransferase family 4 protein [Candidatus Aegiribacteria sp.]|nr:glycosyltransferase family 4 protein [Candidatus Aegiribacteria sp.]
MSIDKKYTVLLVTDGLGLAGAERQLFLTATNLSAQWRVVVWTLHDGHYREKLEEENIRVIISPGEGSVHQAIRSLFCTSSNVKPDLIHVWGSASILLVYILFKCKIPILNGTIRRSNLPSGWINQLRTRISSRIGDLILSNSAAGIYAHGLSDLAHVVIHNGFSWDSIHTANPVEMDAKKTNIVMCANIKPEKDYALLVKVANLALDRSGNSMPYKFWCIGNIVDKAYYDQIYKEAERLLNTGAMVFTGTSDSPADYLASADIGVLLTNPEYHAEGISNSIMEYMAASLPVICSDSGGNTELVWSGNTGFILKGEDVSEILSRMETLRLDSELAHSMGAKGRERILKDFSLENMIAEMESVYVKVINRRE